MRKFFLLLLLLLCGVAGFLLYDYSIFLNTPLRINETNTIFSIEKGDNLSRLSARLADQQAFTQPRYRYYLNIAGRLSQKAHKLKTGDYVLDASMTPQKLLDLFVSGKVLSFSIQFIEGWTFRQFMQAIGKSSDLKQTLTHTDNASVMRELGLGTLSAEGLFFPDTYQFTRAEPDRQILLRANAQMQQKLAKVWDARQYHENDIIKTPYDLLILASLVEKETAVDSERAAVAGVFYRRLQQGMKLQTDPTVIYGMGDKYTGRLLYKDLQADTPYNTYTRTGLPPTPIAAPSEKSLHAAANPEQGSALFFVADGRGGHVFADTYAEHLQNVKSYRQQQKQQQQNTAENLGENSRPQEAK